MAANQQAKDAASARRAALLLSELEENMLQVRQRVFEEQAHAARNEVEVGQRCSRCVVLRWLLCFVPAADGCGQWRALDDAEQARAEEAINYSDDHELLVTINNIEVHGRDARRLGDAGWLNDEIVNAYGVVLQWRADADPKT